MKVVFTAHAVFRLRQILAFIAADSPANAVSMVEGMIARAETLDTQSDGKTLSCSGWSAWKRPSGRARANGLWRTVYNHWAKKIAEADVEKFVDPLIAAGKLSETGSAVTYHL